MLNTAEDEMRMKEEDQQEKLKKIDKIQTLIADGAGAFLYEEYIFIGVFVILFAGVIAFVVEKNVGEFWTVVPFLLGSITSIISGYIGMKIAVKANARCTIESSKSLERGFIVAFRGGIVLGFVLVGLALLVLMLLLMIY